jgi:hypothetical protein
MKTKAAHITEEQSNAMTGQLYADDIFFNPFQDVDGKWCISEVEVMNCINPDFAWVNTLEVVDVELPEIEEDLDTPHRQ